MTAPQGPSYQLSYISGPGLFLGLPFILQSSQGGLAARVQIF